MSDEDALACRWCGRPLGAERLTRQECARCTLQQAVIGSYCTAEAYALYRIARGDATTDLCGRTGAVRQEAFAALRELDSGLENLGVAPNNRIDLVALETLRAEKSARAVPPEQSCWRLLSDPAEHRLPDHFCNTTVGDGTLLLHAQRTHPLFADFLRVTLAYEGWVPDYPLGETARQRLAEWYTLDSRLLPPAMPGAAPDDTAGLIVHRESPAGTVTLVGVMRYTPDDEDSRIIWGDYVAPLFTTSGDPQFTVNEMNRWARWYEKYVQGKRSQRGAPRGPRARPTDEARAFHTARARLGQDASDRAIATYMGAELGREVTRQFVQHHRARGDWEPPRGV